METEQKQVCQNCIGDEFIKKRIDENDENNLCSYCEEQGKTVSIKQMSEWVDEVYRKNYVPGEEYQIDDNKWETTGDYPENIISEEILETGSEIASDIVSLLSQKEQYSVIKDGEEAYYDTTSQYESMYISSYEHNELWNEFCRIVKHQSRFYNTQAEIILKELFDGIKYFKHVGDKGPIRNIGPGTDETSVFRARKIRDNNDIVSFLKNPGKELGPPPKSKAYSGRMNPAGIPVFYGAMDQDTCIAEIRLPVGAMTLLAKFEIIRPLVVLDLTLFNRMYEKLSYFDPDFETKASRGKFLRRFTEKIAEPVQAGDKSLDYIPTQAFAEYLANKYDPKIDALIYASSQIPKGKNIVILSHAASVEMATEEMYSESQPEVHIDEDMGFCSIGKIQPTNEFMFDLANPVDKDDYLFSSTPSLRLIPDSIALVKADSVKYETRNITIIHEKE
jgi:hypothetical protein